MAAPINKFIWKKLPKILRVLGVQREQFGSLNKFLISKDTLLSVQPKTCHSHSVHGLAKELIFSKNVLQNTNFSSPLAYVSGKINSDKNEPRRQFGTSSGNCGDDKGGNEQPSPFSRQLRLMDFPELVWPHPLKTLRNMFMSFLIGGYMDQHFTPKKFLQGAEQAVTCVSHSISTGQFEELEGLVTNEAIREIRQNYQSLDAKQRHYIAVNPKDIFYRFIYEIGMIFDDQTDQRYVEITAVFQGYHGCAGAQDKDLMDMENARENTYVCNYRFIREYTKESTDTSDWTINKLNHFRPSEYVQRTGFFDR